MNKIVFLLIAVFAFSCSPKPDAWQLKLPAHFNTKFTGDLAAQLPDSVLGKGETRAFLFEENGVKVYMNIPLPVDDYYPFLSTVDKDGKTIDSLIPFENPEERNEDSSEDITILPDKTIVAIDSLYSINVDVNDEGEITQETKMLSVMQKKFRISATGEFEMFEEKSAF